MQPARCVGAVLGMRPIAYDKDLHVLEQATSAPEAVTLVPFNLIESLLDGHVATLQLREGV